MLLLVLIFDVVAGVGVNVGKVLFKSSLFHKNLLIGLLLRKRGGQEATGTNKRYRACSWLNVRQYLVPTVVVDHFDATPPYEPRCIAPRTLSEKPLLETRDTRASLRVSQTTTRFIKPTDPLRP